MKYKISLLSILAIVAALSAVGIAEAVVHHRKPTRATHAHGLAAPRLQTPANGQRFEQLPVLTWSAVSRAAAYEYQVAADPAFKSIVLGSGRGAGSATTHNLAATLDKSLIDGTYYWRVRAITATKEAGPWSAIRRVVKDWSARPALIAPGSGAAIMWPSDPLLMKWTAVPYATEYIVTIATDPALSNVVLGSATSPQKTDGTVFALPGTLAAGQYYWAITPVDAQGHRGTRSSVATFSWAWPTSTHTQVSDLNPDPRVFEPQFSWAPVPGAARYEVEVNSSSEFPPGSKWCCSNVITGTSFTPTQVLANNGYYWRVRALDSTGHAGVWNEGPTFTKAFDSTEPTVPNLTLSDVDGNPLPPGTTTDTPLVTWSPVPGAASYEVQATRYTEGNGCDWAASSTSEKQTVETSSLAWTPLGPDSKRIGPTAWPSPRTSPQLMQGETPFCVRVLARSDRDALGNQVVSNWTQIGGVNQPAFRFANSPAPGAPGPEGLVTRPWAYALPAAGSLQPRTPLFTWHRVPGASLYYVVVARDAGFTHVVDIASTVVPAYAPPLSGEEPLDDETTSFYWAVVPVNAKAEVFSDPSQGQDAPQTFNKSSVPPAPLGPLTGATVGDQPTFSWTPAEGAINYTLQVSADPTFGKPIDNVRTDSTSYTSSSTYPAGVTLYWRVRANDTNTANEGLNWSAVQTFRRTLPVPSPTGETSGSTEGITPLLWTPVPGAIAYDVHVEQPDGTTRDWTVDSTADTPTEWAGPGIWRWQVRAQFPTNVFNTVTGGYFQPQPIAHLFAGPTGVKGVKSGARIVISWNPEAYAKEYEAQVSTTDTFTSTVASDRVQGTFWAPDVDLSRPANKKTLYWRLAARDKRGNLSPFVSGRFSPPRPAAKCASAKSKKKGKKIKVCAKPRRAKKKHH